MDRDLPVCHIVLSAPHLLQFFLFNYSYFSVVRFTCSLVYEVPCFTLFVPCSTTDIVVLLKCILSLTNPSGL